MFIEVKNYVIYYNLSDKVIEFIIGANSKLAIRDTEPTTLKKEEYTREDENGETITEQFEQQVVDTSLITEDEYKLGYTTGLEYCNTDNIKYQWLELYKDMSWYTTEKTNLTNTLIAIKNENKRQELINSNFEFNGKTYYGDQRGREAILGTALIGCVYILKNILTDEQIATFNEKIQLPYSDVNGELVTFGVNDFFNMAIEYMKTQQNATLNITK
jgi:hypothetical protein